jgi:hypothetical protein
VSEDTAQAKRIWVVAGRVLAGGAALVLLFMAVVVFWFASCHDGGGFCAGEKTSSEAWGEGLLAAGYTAVAGVLACAALAVPRRRWATAATVVALVSLVAGGIAYAA